MWVHRPVSQLIETTQKSPLCQWNDADLCLLIYSVYPLTKEEGFQVKNFFSVDCFLAFTVRQKNSFIWHRCVSGRARKEMITDYHTLLSMCSSLGPYVHINYKPLYKPLLLCNFWPSQIAQCIDRRTLSYIYVYLPLTLLVQLHCLDCISKLSTSLKAANVCNHCCNSLHLISSEAEIARGKHQSYQKRFTWNVSGSFSLS